MNIFHCWGRRLDAICIKYAKTELFAYFCRGIKILDMTQTDIAYLNQFELKLEEELLKICTEKKMLGGILLATDDIDALWKESLAAEYVADAVREVAAYPVVSVAWAAYLGMAVAKGWDADWGKCLKTPYADYYGARRFDDMDEHIVRDILGLDLEGDESKAIEEQLRICGEKTVGLIRHEHIEPQSIMAFHVFARAAKAMFRIGAALQLYRMGYKFEKVKLSDLNDPRKLS